MPRRAIRSKLLRALLRLAGTAAGLGYIAWKVDFAEAGDALARISIATFALAAALVALNVVVGAIRWRVVLRAYGALAIPPLPRLVRLYFVAFFYNTYLPGAVAGDVARGVVAREAFGGDGIAGSLAVVLVERALGLFALFTLLAIGLCTDGSGLDTGSLWLWTAIGCAGSCALVAAIPLAKRLAPHLPGPLGRIAGTLPVLRDGRQLVLAIALSLGTQVCIALAGWVILDALAPIGFSTSLLIVPLAAATAFLPITVGGAGAREAVYVELCGRLLGMAQPVALAASLGLWLAHLAIGLVGLVAQVAAGKRAA